MANNSLIAVEKLDVAVVFSESGMIKLLEEIETKAISHVPDITSEQGRKDIASLAYKVTRSKTLIDDLGKEVVSDWKKKAKTIDGHRKIARDFLDNLKDKVRQPLTEWEAAEAIIKKEEAALEKEKINKRVLALFAVDVNIPYFDAAMLNDVAYQAMLDAGTGMYQEKRMEIEKKKAAQKAEDERLKVEAERLKKIQEAQEAEMKKELAVQEAKLEEIRVAQEKATKALQKKEDALKAKEQAIEDAKRKEQDRLDKIVLEEQAKIQATKDVEAKIEREKKEEAERLVAKEIEKKRQAEIAPDRGKLIDLAMTIRQIISPPAIKDEIAKEIVETILVALSIIADNLVIQAEDL